jgi:hypothetical protein
MATNNKATHSLPSGASSGQIAIPGDRCNPSDDASEPLLDEAAAISSDGSWGKQSDYSKGTWEAILHDVLPFDAICNVFSKGTELSIVRDHLDTLTISDDARAEIVEGLFS